MAKLIVKRQNIGNVKYCRPIYSTELPIDAPITKKMFILYNYIEGLYLVEENKITPIMDKVSLYKILDNEKWIDL